jgi:hypothetical protein
MQRSRGHSWHAHASVSWLSFVGGSLLIVFSMYERPAPSVCAVGPER